MVDRSTLLRVILPPVPVRMPLAEAPAMLTFTLPLLVMMLSRPLASEASRPPA
ncbi:hypothetical protein D3C76_1278480 [compost metagenome]